jgi:L-threonylcarbamoyladenylate synthase
VLTPAEAADCLRHGGLVAHATTSLLGLAADPRSDAGLDRLDALKSRATAQGYVLVAGRLLDCSGWVAADASEAWFLLEHPWSGPVTVVAPAGPAAPRRIQGPGDTVAVRLDRHPSCLALAAELGTPWVSTSVNLPGEPPALTWEDVPEAVGRSLSGVLSAGPAPLGTASSLVRVLEGEVELVRAGPVALGELRQALRDRHGVRHG